MYRGSATAQVALPENFIDCISCSFFKDPVVTADGQTYERSWIQDWFSRGHTTSPLTNLPLVHTNLTPNIALRNSIEEFLKQHPEIDREGFKMEKQGKTSSVSWTEFLVGTALFAIGYLLGRNNSKDAEQSKGDRKERKSEVIRTGFAS
jgi:hypothetical protein